MDHSSPRRVVRMEGSNEAINSSRRAGVPRTHICEKSEGGFTVGLGGCPGGEVFVGGGQIWTLFGLEEDGAAFEGEEGVPGAYRDFDAAQGAIGVEEDGFE